MVTSTLAGLPAVSSPASILRIENTRRSFSARTASYASVEIFRFSSSFSSLENFFRITDVGALPLRKPGMFATRLISRQA